MSKFNFFTCHKTSKDDSTGNRTYCKPHLKTIKRFSGVWISFDARARSRVQDPLKGKGHRTCEATEVARCRTVPLIHFKRPSCSGCPAVKRSQGSGLRTGSGATMVETAGLTIDPAHEDPNGVASGQFIGPGTRGVAKIGAINRDVVEEGGRYGGDYTARRPATYLSRRLPSRLFRYPIFHGRFHVQFNLTFPLFMRAPANALCFPPSTVGRL